MNLLNNKIIKFDYFSKIGIEYTIGSDFSTHPYSYADTPGE
jgi:hypothetical protein